MFSKSNILHRNIVLTLLTMLLVGGIFLFASGSSPAAHAQSSNDLSLYVTGPTYVQAGAELTYEFKLVNHTSQAYTDITFYNDLFDGVTYVSGGELIDADPDYVVLTFPNLAPNATETVTWVAQANSGLALGTVLTNSSYGPIDTPTEAMLGYGSDPTTLVEAPGTVVATYKNAAGRPFDVMVDGYGFENFTHTSPAAVRNFSNDLLPEDLFMMFGEAVCISGNTAETCVLNAAGQKWLDDQIIDMDLAVCDGMASSSLHIFDQREFKGFTTPGTIQSGAVNTVDLDFPEDAIENYVSYYYNTQLADEVYYSHVVGSANDTIATLQAAMDQTPPTFYTLNVEVLLENGQTKDGHAITPIAIEEVSNTESRIIVYDNNYPKQRQYIVVNTAENSWRYVTEATPGEGSSIYEGVGDTNPIQLVPLNVRDNAEGEYFNCYFCNSSAGSSEAASNKLTANSAAPLALATENTGLVRLSYSGEGAYMVVDHLGRATGSETDTGALVNEIPGADIITHRGGLGLNVPPRINVPFDGPDDTFYSVFVHANTEGDVTNGDLNIHGHGFSIGVNGISLDPFEEYEILFSPDGDHISFYATETIVAPELVIAHDPINPGDPSVIFDIEGVVLVAGETVTLDLDPELEQIHFSHTGPEAENFVIDMRLIWPDGDVEDYPETIHIPAGVQTAFVDFGAWDGLLDPPIYVGGVLQNPGANHRLKLENAVGSYNPTPQPHAPAGVYTVEATFSNVTEVSLEDLFFSIVNLAPEDVLLNADPGSGGTRVSVPDHLVGADGILHPFDTFTFTFEIGLGDANFSNLTVDANGVPHDWFIPNPEPAYDANNESFVFTRDLNDGPTVTGFLLVDADTDVVIGGLSDGDVIDLAEYPKVNIVAETMPTEVGSVVFEVDNKRVRIENVFPYALAGDNNGNYRHLRVEPGSYDITATPFERRGGRGHAGLALTIEVTVIDSSIVIPEVIGFLLVDAKTNEVVGELYDGDIIDLSEHRREQRRINLVAQTTPESVGSVVFELNGSHYRTDNVAPYALPGDSNGNYRHLRVEPGSYVINATPYTERGGRGNAGVALTVEITVVR